MRHIRTLIIVLLTSIVTALASDISSPVKSDPPIELTLYSPSGACPNPSRIPLILELKQRVESVIEISDPIMWDYRMNCPKDFQLPAYDFGGLPNEHGYEVVICGNLEGEFADVRREGLDVPPKLAINTSVLIKVGPMVVLEGTNRFRATLFKDGKPLAVSNVITITGADSPTTAPSAQ